MYSTLDRVGQRQHGMVSTRQLARLGFTDDQVGLLAGNPAPGPGAPGGVPALRGGADVAIGSHGRSPGGRRGRGPLAPECWRALGIPRRSLRVRSPRGDRAQPAPVDRSFGPPPPAGSGRDDQAAGHTGHHGRADVVRPGRHGARCRGWGTCATRVCAVGSLPSAGCTRWGANRGAGRRRLAPIQAVLADRIPKLICDTVLAVVAERQKAIGRAS